MRYVCDAPNDRTWFALETEAEAGAESQLMNHAVEKYFRQEWDKASASFVPASPRYIEQEIGRTAHVQRTMPAFLTLRDHDGHGLATAMLPPRGENVPGFRIIIVGPANGGHQHLALRKAFQLAAHAAHNLGGFIQRDVDRESAPHHQVAFLPSRLSASSAGTAACRVPQSSSGPRGRKRRTRGRRR